MSGCKKRAADAAAAADATIAAFGDAPNAGPHSVEPVGSEKFGLFGPVRPIGPSWAIGHGR